MRPTANPDLMVLTESDTFQGAVRELKADERFRRGLDGADFESLQRDLRTFQRTIGEYLSYHRLERRLWAVRLGTGRARPAHEERLQRAVEPAQKAYDTAFGAMGRCIAKLNESELGEVLSDHIDRFAPLLADPDSPLRHVTEQFFVDAGCTPGMVRDFTGRLEKTGFRFSSGLGAGASELLEASNEGPQEAVRVHPATWPRAHRGQCGPALVGGGRRRVPGRGVRRRVLGVVHRRGGGGGVRHPDRTVRDEQPAGDRGSNRVARS